METTYKTFAGSYVIVTHTMRNGKDYDDGDTRTIKYVSGEFKGRVIEQLFEGDGAGWGGWVDVD
jgi:hypothetical protein